MCSVSWRFREGGYELVFNRDEKWSRKPSLGFKFENHHKVPGFCARDTQGNGTWLFTNETGLTLALFNAYSENAPKLTDCQTRGQIPLFAGDTESMEALVQLLKSKNYKQYAPFDLFLLDGSTARRFGWDRVEFREKTTDALPFLTSSSVNSQQVIAARRKRYEQISHLPLMDILKDTKATKPEEAIYVTREDGGTVSQTIVRVSGDDIQFSVVRRGEEPHFESISRKYVAVLD